MSRYRKHTDRDEQTIYDHLLYWVDLETPDELIARFQALFIDAPRYPDPEVSVALDRVTASRTAKEEFRYVLNRCCHILINRWQARSQYQSAIPKLITLFEDVQPPSSTSGAYRTQSARRLRELVAGFRETEQFSTLHRIAQVIEQPCQPPLVNPPLGTLIPRYPYLYEHCLLSEDSDQEQQRTVRRIQAERQHQFEVDLSQYVTSMVRRSQLASRISPTAAQRVVRSVPNPTLLPDHELGLALKHYLGKVDGNNTYRDLAHSFIARSTQSHSYRAFKDDLYEYITASVGADYGSRQFNDQLYRQLKVVSPENNTKPVNDFLIVRTCSQLLNFLVVENGQQRHHFVFIDLTNNLGPILTTGLLLKIVLICRKVKPYLERRLALLFNHYETYESEVVRWLVQVLENINVALSVHFGNLDLSFIR